MPLMHIVEAVALMNALAFLAFGYDKWQARRGGWRVPEANLLLFSILGGALGGFAGMKFFRHKTRKAKFQLLLPFLMLMQLCALTYLTAAQ